MTFFDICHQFIAVHQEFISDSEVLSCRAIFAA